MLVWAAQEGCGLSFLGGTQKPSRHCPGQPALRGPDGTWSWPVLMMISRGSLQSQPFCVLFSNECLDSVITTQICVLRS